MAAGFTSTDLENVEAAIRARLAGGVASYSIAGRSLQYHTLQELLKLRTLIRSELHPGNDRTLADVSNFQN